jgi:hypothetical protein
MILGALLCVALFVGMVVLQEAGRRIGRRRDAHDPDSARVGLNAIEGSIFALLGLLIAFTFAAAATRFEMRRQLVIQEANAIGTAWLRLDLLPAAAQPGMRRTMRDYVDARLAAYRQIPDLDAAQRELARAQALQGDLWSAATAAANAGAPSPTTMLLLPALNEMFDITTTRTMSARAHTPPIVIGLLFAVSLGCALFAGFGTATASRRSLIHMVFFAAVVTVTVYVILDLEYPRIGLIRVDEVDQALEDVRAGMK